MTRASNSTTRSNHSFAFVVSIATGVYLRYRRDNEDFDSLWTSVVGLLVCLVGLVVGYRSAERFASDRP
ncbi:hypothetical protein BRD01_10130 [Halobacteriales archaeon QS_8_65_32]|nr:MAG: hypothetical protein BRD01_10130 [Halobacteriales archaeon QS_8_65_32]